MLPLYFNAHDGTLSVGEPGEIDAPDLAGDGLIYVSDQTLRHEYSLQRISAKALERARRVLLGEIDEYGAYLCGEVFGYVIEDASGEHLDSCWGFYEREDCEQQANEAAEHCAQEHAAEAREAHEMACRGIQTLAA
jgi:hypothetical protein